MKRSLQEIAQAVGARLIGDGRVEVSAVASIESASRDDLVFVEDEKHLAAGLAIGGGRGHRRGIRRFAAASSPATVRFWSAIIPSWLLRAPREFSERNFQPTALRGREACTLPR